jgi:hypothetical protein
MRIQVERDESQTRTDIRYRVTITKDVYVSPEMEDYASVPMLVARSVNLDMRADPIRFFDDVRDETEAALDEAIKSYTVRH